MTKHRKIFEGVSEYPLEETEYDYGVSVIRMPHESQPRMGFANPPDAKFWLYARNQWPAICDLIEAVEEFKRADEETNKCTELLIFDPCTPKAAEIMQAMYKAKDQLFVALDKLNKET